MQSSMALSSRLAVRFDKYRFLIAICLFSLVILGFFTQLFEDWIPTSKNTEYWWSVNVSEGTNIYPKEEGGFIEGISCAYMPFYFIVTGNAMKIFGTSPIVGKMVSTFAALGTAVLIYYIGCNISGRKWLSMLLGVMFLVYPVVIDYSSSEVKIDILGLFLSTLGLYLVLIGRWNWSVFPLVLAFFTKQFYIVVPATVMLWLLFKNWHLFFSYYLMYLWLIITGFVVGEIVTGGTFFEHTVLYLQSPEFGGLQVDRTIGSSLVCLGYLAPAVLVAVYGMWRTREFGLLGLYLVLALALMVFMVSKEGSGTNYTLESIVAACCLSALAIKDVGRKDERSNGPVPQV